MERRDVLRAMAVLAITPRWLLAQAGQNSTAAPVLPAPVPWTLGLNPRTPLPNTTVADAMAETVPSYFSAAGWQRCSGCRTSLCLEANIQAPWTRRRRLSRLSDWSLAAVRGTLYKTGLLWLDGQAKLKFRKPFAEASNNEAGGFFEALVANVDDRSPADATARRLREHCARGHSYGDDEFQAVAGFAG